MCIFRGQAPSCLSYLRHFHTQNSEDILPPPFVPFPLPKTKCCLAQIDAAVVVVVFVVVVVVVVFVVVFVVVVVFDYF